MTNDKYLGKLTIHELLRDGRINVSSINFKNLILSSLFILINTKNSEKMHLQKLQRLTDLRFLSIDFLNTFLLTYRVFAEGVQVDFILS